MLVNTEEFLSTAPTQTPAAEPIFKAPSTTSSPTTKIDLEDTDPPYFQFTAADGKLSFTAIPPPPPPATASSEQEVSGIRYSTLHQANDSKLSELVFAVVWHARSAILNARVVDVYESV
jgi:hypothetical protein